MNIDSKIKFSKTEEREISRMLQYIDFRNKQQWCVDDVDKTNITATTVAALMLSGYDYTKEQLQHMISNESDTSHDAIRVRRYQAVVSDMLSSNESANPLDEMAVISLFNRVYCEDTKGGVTLQSQPSILPSTQHNATPRTSGRSIYTHPELSELIEWLLVRPCEDKLHPIIVIAAFLYEFVARDTLPMGKEEISHLLAIRLLRQQQAHWIALYTPCRTMTADILTYHRKLKGRENIGNDISRWIIYWTERVYETAQLIAQSQAPALPPIQVGKKSSVNIRQRRILDFIEKNQPVKLAEITAHLHKESINTIKKDLLYLRQSGYITADGVLKGTVYYRH